MTPRFALILPLAPLLLGGCVRTVVGVATAPVRVASWGVDKATTSQSEADRNAGRKMRKEHAREDREARKREREEAEAQQRENGRN